MTITKLQRIVVDALVDIKAQDIRVFNTTGLSDLFDRVVVASATSNRQTRALASHLREKVKERGFDVVASEGEETGEWVLVDLGDLVVHIMQPAIRTYYNLEELWGAKPVRLKVNGELPGGAAATRREAPAKARAKAPKKAPVKSAPVKSAPVKVPGRTGGRTPAAAPTKVPARKGPALRRVAAGKTVR